MTPSLPPSSDPGAAETPTLLAGEGSGNPGSRLRSASVRCRTKGGRCCSWPARSARTACRPAWRPRSGCGRVGGSSEGTLGQFGGKYLLTLLPPGWESRTSVHYSVRLIDVKSEALLMDSVRQRTAGGYLAVMTATYADDLEADLASVLTAQD